MQWLGFLRAQDLSSVCNLFVKNEACHPPVPPAYKLLAQHFSSSVHFNQDGPALSEVYHLPPYLNTRLVWYNEHPESIPVNHNPTERQCNLHLLNFQGVKVEPEYMCHYTVERRFYSFMTKTQKRQLHLPGMRDSRGQMNQDRPFINVSIQGATTAAQVSSCPVERSHISALHRGAPLIAVMAHWELLSW